MIPENKVEHWARIHAKVAAMTDEEQEARMHEIYSMADEAVTTDMLEEFFAVMFGGYEPSSSQPSRSGSDTSVR
jgi:hypothetical protein